MNDRLARRDIVITGFGVLTAFGFGADALRRTVFAGRPGFAPVTRFDTGPFRCHHAATYRGGDPRLPEVPRQLDALIACTRAAIEMARLPTPYPAPVLVATQGDFTEVNRFWRAAAQGGEPPSPRELARSVPGELADRLGAEFGLGRPRIALVNACVAASTAIIHAAQLVAAGRADAAVCAGCYLVDEEFFAKFDAGRALTTEGAVRPFATGRTGLLLGDGAAALVIEAAEHAAARSVPPLARLAGWGWSGDAFHQCRPDPEGNGLAAAITHALRRAGCRPDQVGYVNAHGTGTPVGDVAETRALRKALGGEAAAIPVSSTKSTTGHLLEASGAVEAVISLLALREGVLPPTAGLDRPDPACDLDYIPLRSRRARPRYALSVNSAFGGANTALLLERVPVTAARAPGGPRADPRDARPDDRNADLPEARPDDRRDDRSDDGRDSAGAPEPARVIATARLEGTEDPPGVPGFIVSRFNPLVNEAVRRCLAEAGDAVDVSGPGTALLLGSVFGDTTTSDTASAGLVAGDVRNPLLFYQSVPTTILGHVAREYGITGPIVCCSIRTDPAGTLRDLARLLLLEDEISRVLMIEVELAAGRRVAHLTEGSGPAGDTATARLLGEARGPRGSPGVSAGSGLSDEGSQERCRPGEREERC
jgi:3-oxoacyl-[acyl-carrier-protein] synthase II